MGLTHHPPLSFFTPLLSPIPYRGGGSGPRPATWRGWQESSIAPDIEEPELSGEVAYGIEEAGAGIFILKWYCMVAYRAAV